jgi:hemolysin activation/secretion protein
MFAPPFIADKTLFGQRIAQMVQFALFYDHGGLYNNDPQEFEFSSQHLSGFGAGVRLFYKDSFNFKYDLGIPVDPVEGAPDLINYFTGQVSFF